jgi:hypothetical protein
VTGAFGPLGGTFGFARDSQNTSITFGPAEGFGFFGSAGQGKAASKTSAQATVQGGLGPVGGSLTAGTAGLTGSLTTSEEMNPGISQTQTNSLSLDNNGNLSQTQTQGMGFGFNAGLASTETISISVSNSTLDAIGNAFSAIGNALGLSGSSNQSAPGSEIGGDIPTD